MANSEKEFLKEYDSSKYEKPSVTCDIVILTIDEENDLNVLLIKRKNYPFKDKWAIPGGFVDIKESIDMAAKRELMEETGLSDIRLEQFGTFGEVDRDPRMRVISVAYFALIPKDKLHVVAGDDAKEAEFFKVKIVNGKISFNGLNTKNLAFDHETILNLAITRLRNRIDYTDDVFHFLGDEFTLFEAKKVYEILKGEKLDTANFNRDFLKQFKDKIEKTDKKSSKYSARPASIYIKKE